MQIKDKKNPKKISNSLADYARYSNLAFQMAVILLAGVFGGIKLDKVIQLDFPLFTVLLSLIAVLAAIALAVRDLLKKR